MLLPAALAVMAVCTPGAHAATPASFACTADAVTVQLLGGSVLNPIAAGRAEEPCSLASVGLPNVGEAFKLESVITARTAYAETDPGGRVPYKSKPSARSGVENLDITLGGPLLGVGAARSSITATCVDGTPEFETFSRVTDIRLADTPIVLDGVLQPITDALTDAVGALVEVRLNEVVELSDDGRAIRAARVTLVRGDQPVANVVIAESRLSLNGKACDPVKGAGPVDPTPPVCPAGAFLDVTRNVCVVKETTIVVGPPGKGPTGGTVVGLDDARKRYRSRCLRGAGPRYAVIGTGRADRITGTNRRDRVLSLGGKDRVDTGRRNDCVDGGRGKDRLTGGQAQDRVFGGRGRDVVSGDGGNDRLWGNAGNDFLNAGYSQGGFVKGGKGRDRINVATSGRATRVWGGPQFDLAYANRHERQFMKGVEKRKYVLGPKQKRP